MRITHLYKHYWPHPGGVERAMHSLARLCAAEGHEVRAIVAAETPRRTRGIVDGVEVIGLPSLGELLSMPLAPTYLWPPAREGEILHVHESFPLATLAALARLRRGRAAAIVTWHFDVVRQRSLAPLHRWLASRLLARASAIHVTSDLLASRSRVLARFPAKVRVIPHVVDVARFARAPDHPAARRLRAWAGEDPVALFVGRLVYYKGVDVLLDALARVPRLRLAVVGDGPLRDDLRARAERIGVGPRIRWLGPVSDDGLVGAYSGADVLALPSTAPTETFGMVQVEAMAAGLPVVSTRLGTGVERVNADGVTGRVVAPGDADALAAALGAIAEDAGLRSRYGAAARERAREFDAAHLRARYLALYAEATR
jgi:rhamnosyl/mannosyltransferase